MHSQSLNLFARLQTSLRTTVAKPAHHPQHGHAPCRSRKYRERGRLLYGNTKRRASILCTSSLFGSIGSPSTDRGETRYSYQEATMRECSPRSTETRPLCSPLCAYAVKRCNIHYTKTLQYYTNTLLYPLLHCSRRIPVSTTCISTTCISTTPPQVSYLVRQHSSLFCVRSTGSSWTQSVCRPA